MVKKILLILLSLFVLSLEGMTAFAQASDFSALQPAKEGEMAPIDAVIDSPLNGISHLTNAADDYDVPQGIYFNGVKAKIIAVTKTLGNYPAELTDPEKRWARVVIGASGAYPGITGMMPLENLSPDTDVKSQIPEGELLEDAQLFSDNGLTETVIGNYKKGTKLRVWGWFPEWIQVEIENKTGFVRNGQVSLARQIEELIANAPILGYDEIQPGYQQRYEDYMTGLMKLYDDYGDSNRWPLEVAVEASNLAQKYGYFYSGVVNIMPGENDLQQEDVLIKAQEAALNYFGYDNWESISLVYYYEPTDPNTRIWKASLWGAQNTPDIKIWLNQQGEVIETLNTEGSDLEDLTQYMDEANAEQLPAESKNTVEYYMFGTEATPGQADLTKQDVLDLAFTAFLKKFPDARREEYKADALFMTDFSEETRWWLVTLAKEYTPEITVQYNMVFIGKSPEPAYETHPEFYSEDLKWAESLVRLNEYESEKGPFYTWTLEDKAAWDPEYFGLPQVGDLSQEAATKLARNKVKSMFFLTDEEMENFEVLTYFVLFPARSWQISFAAKESTPPANEAPGYTVVINAVTGRIDDVFSNDYME